MGQNSNRIHFQSLPTAWDNNKRAVPLAWGSSVDSTLLSGLVIRVEIWNSDYGGYQWGDTEDWTIAQIMASSAWQVAFTDGTSLSTIKKRGRLTLKLTYQGPYSTEYETLPIEIGDPVLRSIRLTNTPTSAFVGSQINLGSMKVYGTYSNTANTIQDEYEVSSYSVSCGSDYVFQKSDLTYDDNSGRYLSGTKTITITVGEQTAQFSMTIGGLSYIDVKNAKTSFVEGQTFAYGTGFQVVIVDTAGNEYDITSTCTITNNYAGQTLAIGSYSYDISYTDSAILGSGDTLTKTVDFTVAANTVTGLYIDGTKKVLFNYGDSFTLGTGVKVMAENSNGVDTEVASGDYTINVALGTILQETSTKTITISYGGFEVSYDIDFKYLHSIDITPDEDTFYQNDSFTFGSIVVKAIYKYTDGVTADDEVTLDDDDWTSTYSEGLTLSTAGTQQVQITYNDGAKQVSDHYDITVTAVQVTALSIDTSVLDALTGTQAQGKNTFYEGVDKYYKPSELIITATYNNGTTATIPVSSCTVESGATVGQPFSGTGTKTIELSFGGQSDTYTVTCVAESITAIEIDDSNVVKTFAVGDKFSFSGLVVKAVYNSGRKVEISNYTISPLGNYEFVDNDVGSKTVTVTYGLLTDTYTLTITKPVCTGIELDVTDVNLQPRNQTAFSIGNLVVKMKYSNGLVKTLTRQLSTSPTAGKFYVDLSPLNLDADDLIQCTGSLGIKTITVTGWDEFDVNTEKTTTFNVTVMSNAALRSLYVDTTNAKMNYKTGDQFTGEGFFLVASLVDEPEPYRIAVENNTAVVTDPVMGETLYNAGQKVVTFTYSAGGATRSATVTINVIPSYVKSAPITKTLKVVKYIASTFFVDTLSHVDVAGSGLTAGEYAKIPANPDKCVWLLFDVNDTEIDNTISSATYKWRRIKQNLTNLICYGYVVAGSRTSDSDITVDRGKVVLFKDYIPPIDGSSNITVTFRRTVIGYADKVNYCRGITLYGYKTNRNRAFVYGNVKQGLENIDFRTEPINVAQTQNYEGIADGDLTYFPDTGYTQIGQNSNKIVGDCVLNSGYMMILKSDSRQEPTIYFRHCEYAAVVKADGSTATDFNGNQLYEESYPVEAGNIGDGGITKFGITNFFGDTVYLTKKGLKGVDIGTAGSLVDNTRYATPRSTYIDKRLIKEDLDTSFIYQFQDYLLIACNGVIYVTSYEDHYKRGGKEYEWWYLNNINARIFFEHDDELYFGTEEGRLCKFKFEDKYKDYNDKSRLYIGLGGVLPLSINTNSDRIIFNYNKYKNTFKNGDKLTLMVTDYKEAIYGLLGSFIETNTLANTGADRDDYEGLIIRNQDYIQLDCGDDVEDNGFTKTQNKWKMFYDGRVVYIDNLTQIVPTSRNTVGEPYTIVLTDDNGDDLPMYCFRLKREDGTFADLDNLEIFRMSFRVEDGAIITNVVQDDTNQTLSCQIVGDHDQPVDIIRYASQNINAFKGVVTSEEKVKAYYVTRPYNFSTPLRYKHIWNWLVVNDVNMSSYQDLGYVIDNMEAMSRIVDGMSNEIEGHQSGATQFDLNDSSWDSFTFEVNKMPKSFNANKLLEDVEFIAFVFRNYEDSNIVLSNLTIEYTIGELIY